MPQTKKTVKNTKSAPKAVVKKSAPSKPAQKGGKSTVKKVAPAKSAAKKAQVKKTTKSQKGGSVESRVRYFKIVGEEGEKGRGRFSGRKPKQAANKALTSILKEKDGDGESTKGQFKFSIVECTRGSKNKVYSYVGEKVELDEPMTVQIGDKKITYKHSNVVSKDKEVNAAAQKGGKTPRTSAASKKSAPAKKGKAAAPAKKAPANKTVAAKKSAPVKKAAAATTTKKTTAKKAASKQPSPAKKGGKKAAVKASH
jgi:hypothetical protein